MKSLAAHDDAAGGGDEHQRIAQARRGLPSQVVVEDQGEEQQPRADRDRHEHGERVERRALPTSVLGPSSVGVVPQHHRQHGRCPGGACGDEGVAAVAARNECTCKGRNSAAPTSTSIGDSENQLISGPSNTASCAGIIPQPPQVSARATSSVRSSTCGSARPWARRGRASASGTRR